MVEIEVCGEVRGEKAGFKGRRPEQLVITLKSHQKKNDRKYQDMQDSLEKKLQKGCH